MKITELKIIYGDGVKKEEYGAVRKAEAHLNAIVDEAEDIGAAIEHVARLAINQVNKMIGKAVGTAEGALSVETPANGKAAIAAKEAAKTAEQKAEVVDKKKPGKPKGTKAADKKADESVVEDTSAESVVDDTSTDATTDDAAAVTDDDAGEVSFDLEGEVEAPTEITDGDLNSATQKKNTEIGDPVAIKKLIAQYRINPDPKVPFQLREIPQEKRQDYLDKLAALKKA